MKTHSIFYSILCTLFVLPFVASAAIFSAGETYTLGSDVSASDNIYVAADEVSIQGAVAGDIFSAGGSIIISNNVFGDILVAGGTVKILGDVLGDVRVAGGDVLIGGNVSGDVIMAGGVVYVLPGVTIGKDVVVFGGTVSLEGFIQGDLLVRAEGVVLNARVDGDVQIEASQKILVGGNTLIGGSLTYLMESGDLLMMSPRAIVQKGIIFEEKSNPFVFSQGGIAIVLLFLSGVVVIKLLMFFLVALMLISILPAFSTRVAHSAVMSPWRSLLIGLLTLVITPIVILFLFLTIIGSTLALILLLSYILLIIISGVYAGVIFGAWIKKIWQGYKKKSSREKQDASVTWKSALLGFALLFPAMLLPFIGWAIGLIMFFTAVGALVQQVYRALTSHE